MEDDNSSAGGSVASSSSDSSSSERVPTKFTDVRKQHGQRATTKGSTSDKHVDLSGDTTDNDDDDEVEYAGTRPSNRGDQRPKRSRNNSSRKEPNKKARTAAGGNDHDFPRCVSPQARTQARPQPQLGDRLARIFFQKGFLPNNRTVIWLDEFAVQVASNNPLTDTLPELSESVEIVTDDDLQRWGHHISEGEDDSQNVKDVLAHRQELIDEEPDCHKHRIPAVDSNKNPKDSKKYGMTFNTFRGQMGFTSAFHASPVAPWQIAPIGDDLVPEPEIVIVSADGLIDGGVMEMPNHMKKKSTKKNQFKEICFTFTVADACALKGKSHDEHGFLYVVHPTNKVSLDLKQMNGVRARYCSTQHERVRPDAVLMYIKLTDENWLLAWVWQKDANGPFAQCGDSIAQSKLALVAAPQSPA